MMERHTRQDRREHRAAVTSGLRILMARLWPLAVLASLLMPGAYAQESMPTLPQVEIATCTLTAGAGVVDFGRRSRGQLESIPGGMSPGNRHLTVSAQCSVTQAMTLRFRGPARGELFSWGGVDSVLRVRAGHGQMDGQPVQLQRLNSAGTRNGEPRDEVMLHPGDMLTAVNNGQPVSGRVLSVMLEIEPVMGEKDSRPVTLWDADAVLGVSLEP